MTESQNSIGVAIVAFNSSDVIIGCLASLFASRDADLRVIVVDNQSQDDTLAVVRQWAEGHRKNDDAFTFEEVESDDLAVARASLTLLHSPFNGGYAHGVNAGLKPLLADPALNLFWVLNPDCEVTPEAAARYIAYGADQAFSLMSGRTVYRENPDQIQTDGGRVGRWTGVCSPVNIGRSAATTPIPESAALDFIAGSNMVASRRFIDQAGLMREDYFLFYEEVDWAFRRGDLPLRFVDDVIVLHHGGTSIGSGALHRRATAFANYFNYRNRIRFLRRFHPISVPTGLAYALAKAIQLTLIGARDEAQAVIAGAFGLAPPGPIRDRIAPGRSRELAFGRSR